MRSTDGPQRDRHSFVIVSSYYSLVVRSTRQAVRPRRGQTGGMSDSRRVIPVILAAGRGTRWDGEGHKLLARLHGRPVVEHALRAAVGSGFGPVVLVTGAVAVPIPDDLAEQVITTENPRWSEGQSTSLAIGVRRAADL